MLLIIEKPVKIMFLMAFMLMFFTIGVKNIKLATGNETLIKPSSDVYLDNDQLESTFGSDPIIVLYEASDITGLFTVLNMKSLYDLEMDLNTNPAVFSVTSPASIIYQMSSAQYLQYKTGLAEMIVALHTIGLEIQTLSQNNDVNVTQFEGNEIGNVTNLEPSIQEIVENLTLVSDQMTTLADSNVSIIPQNTINDLNHIQNELINIGDLPTGSLQLIGTKLINMSAALSNMLAYSDGTVPSIPSSQATIDKMIYTDQLLKPMFNNFIIDNHSMIITIKLKANTSDEQIEMIIDSINDSLSQDNIIISGKPVLDLSIKTSMKSSMQNMMVLAILLMVLVLWVTFKVRWRLLPLVMIILAVIGTVGVMGWLNIPITMVSMAVFPILIGLGIDYGIQFQNRYFEEMEDVVYE